MRQKLSGVQIGIIAATLVTALIHLGLAPALLGDPAYQMLGRVVYLQWFGLFGLVSGLFPAPAILPPAPCDYPLGFDGICRGDDYRLGGHEWRFQRSFRSGCQVSRTGLNHPAVFGLTERITRFESAGKWQLTAWVGSMADQVCALDCGFMGDIS